MRSFHELQTPCDTQPPTTVPPIVSLGFPRKNVSCHLLFPAPISKAVTVEPISDSAAPPRYSLFWPARLLPTRLWLILLGDLNLLAFHQGVRRIDHHIFLSAEPGNYLHFAPEIAPQHNRHESRLIAVLDRRNLQAL